jgi:hypothetical protein
VGYIDFQSEPDHTRRIRRALESRGLQFDPAEEWEIHGPHQDMNYEVYVGTAREGKMLRTVAIWPKAVYAVGDTSRWWDISPENRLAKRKAPAAKSGMSHHSTSLRDSSWGFLRGKKNGLVTRDSVFKVGTRDFEMSPSHITHRWSCSSTIDHSRAMRQ